MANLFQFATTPPADGEIRAFIKEDIDGTQIVRALTVDNNSLDGRGLIPTLQTIQSISLKLTGSGDFSNLKKLTVAQKSSYFFIDNIDVTLASVSSSLSSSVTFDPFQIRSFDNDNYNALISNATVPRSSNGRYVLNRVSGDPFPTNYEASQGIEVLSLYLSPTSFDNFPARFSSSLNTAITLTGTALPFNNDEDVTLTITQDEILKAVGNIDESVKFGHGGTPDSTIITAIILRVDNEKEFNTGHSKIHTLYESTWHNGNIIKKEVYPLHHSIPSGSAATATGGGTNDVFFYTRTEVNFSRPAGGSQTNLYYFKPRLLELDPAQDYFTVRCNKGIPSTSSIAQIPYGERASVPDSNYTATGFANARFNGSKTTAADYGGIDPALTARVITILPLIDGPLSSSFDSPSGSFARSWFNMNNLLKGFSGSDGTRQEYAQQYEEIAYSGLRDKPDVNVGVVAKFSSGSNLHNPNLIDNDSDTSFDINTFGFGDRIQVGDLVSFTSGSKTETVQVTSKNPKINPNHGKTHPNIINLTVIRGAGADGQKNNGVTPTQLDLTLKRGDRLITIEGTKIIPQQQLRAVINPQEVKDNPDEMVIVETDFKGFIINAYTSGSQDGA